MAKSFDGGDALELDQIENVPAVETFSTWTVKPSDMLALNADKEMAFFKDLVAWWPLEKDAENGG